MKNADKYLIGGYGIAVIIILSLIITCAHACGKKKEIKSIATIEKIKQAPVIHSTDKQGLDHAQKQVAIADDEIINTLYDHILDSVMQHVKIKNKNSIENITAISSETQESFKPTITYVQKDTCSNNYADSFYYHDIWTDVTASIANDSAVIKTRDSLIFTTYWQHNKLLLDGFSLNKNSTIKGITAVDLHQAKPHKFGIDVTVGYFWNGKQLKPGAGAGIAYRITK